MERIEQMWKQNKVLRLTLISVLAYLFFRYVFPLLSPFAFAFLFVSLCYPLLQKIQRMIPLKKKFLAIGIAIPFLLLFFGILWFFLTTLCEQAAKLPGLCNTAGKCLEQFFHQCCCELEVRFGLDGGGMETYLVEQMTVMMDKVQIQVLPQVLSSSYSGFKSLLSVLAFVAVTGVAVFLLEKDYRRFCDYLEKEMKGLFCVGKGIVSYLVTFLKAQGVILLAISILCTTVLGFLGIEGFVFLGILAGILDMLPFIGTGIVLVPVSLWQLLNGNYGKMIICIILYGSCALLREWLEPKLIGKRVGIPPVLMLLAIYAGVKLFGVFGIIKGPLALIVIYETEKLLSQKFDEPTAAVYDK